MRITSLFAVMLATLACAPCVALSKDIVVLLDGTWNNTIDYGGHRSKVARRSIPLKITDKAGLSQPLPPEATNIARMFMMLENKAEQEVVYIRGVGTDDKADQWIGGAFGKGANERVKTALKFIDEQWRPGDEICIFGFSRGAATARLLANEIQERPIRFMGLFDTVASFGVPRAKLEDGSFRKEFDAEFAKLAIPASVKRVVHLVALDENRSVFRPTLLSSNPSDTDRRREIWLGGNHGDVGGGWTDEDETDKKYRRRQIALWYMLTQNHGLDLIPDWQEQDDVRIDPAWTRCGKKHGGDDYRFTGDIGGEAQRIPPFVPYDPRDYSAVLHASATK
jgi:hypothetical protein